MKTQSKQNSKPNNWDSRPNIVVLGGCSGPITMAGGRVTYVSAHDTDAWKVVANEHVDGLLLLGGGDVNPNLYGGERVSQVYGVDDVRDEAEWWALEEARMRGIAIMGICRGSQIMNVHAGGTLHEDIQSLKHTHQWHQGSDCRVVAVRGSRLAKAWRQREQWTIHLHHQAVKDVAPGFVPSAYAHDGTIEAIESVEGWELGVQFHPEMDSDTPAMQRIFNRFVLGAARLAGLPDSTPRRFVPDTKTAASHMMWWDREDEEHESIKSASDSATVLLPSKVSDIKRSWRCTPCGNMLFDKKEDFNDHMLYLHETPLALVDGKGESGVFQDDDQKSLSTLFAERS